MGEECLEALELMMRACVGPNLFTYHNEVRCTGLTMAINNHMFQIDANMGLTSAVLELLMDSAPGCVWLLPSLPAAWKRGRFSGLSARGAVTVDCVWSPEAVEVTLYCPKAQTVTLYLPGGMHHRCTLEAGVAQTLTFPGIQ